MTIKEAKNILNSFRKNIIKDVYDKYSEVSEAILILLPSFEYPDWSYRTVDSFLKERN